VGSQRRHAPIGVVATILLVLVLASPTLAELWSFAVIADNRDGFTSYRNVLREVQTMTVNPSPKFPPIELVLACGDLDPLPKNHRIYLDVFEQAPPAYLPVRGNHERPEDVTYIRETLLPRLDERGQRLDQRSIQYTCDWKNCRFIVLDQYAGEHQRSISPKSLQWLEQAITSAKHLDHVFVAFHEPVVARSGQDQGFWDLLLQHQDKVRTVFVGHTHRYERSRVGHGDAAIDLINAGNAGKSNHSDHHQTIVEVMVDGPTLTYRSVRAPDGTADFLLSESWQKRTPQ
jgi:hypothetical protein